MIQKNNSEVEYSSFKDKDAAICYIDNEVYRKINYSYKSNYDKLMNSGLYDALVKEGLLIPHKEVDCDENNVYKIIKPNKVLITYPWEWSFSALKDAAIATLNIQIKALEYGMSLKDANCFNIQFYEGCPTLIDTTSFEEYKEGYPWVAYKQFCENFLGPLALMAYKDIHLNTLLITNINGIPLDLIVKLLPKKVFFNLGLFLHLKLHASFQTKYSNTKKKEVNVKISKSQEINMLKDLVRCVENIKLKNIKTEWKDYYDITNYSEETFSQKHKIIDKWRDKIKPNKVWDFGANSGEFSRIFKDCAQEIVSSDIDVMAVENNYLEMKQNNEKNIIPIVYDLVNPSPSIGWNNGERLNLKSRIGNVDLSLALALIHHLRITYNIPFEYIRDYFCEISPYLIIEFVEKEDSQIQKMLMNREDVFDDYNVDTFEKIFSEKYEISEKLRLGSSKRIMYLMRKL